MEQEGNGNTNGGWFASNDPGEESKIRGRIETIQNIALLKIDKNRET